MLFDTHNATPTQHLIACLAAIRGGVEVPEEVLGRDLAHWIDEHGPISREKVDRWAQSSFELRFAIDVLVNRPVAAK